MTAILATVTALFLFWNEVTNVQPVKVFTPPCEEDTTETTETAEPIETDESVRLEVEPLEEVHTEDFWGNPEDGNYGTYGRLRVETGIDVPLYYVYDDGGQLQNEQWITDCYNSAVIIDYSWFAGRESALVIADHKDQGFDALYDVIPGQTIAQINFADGSYTRYICEMKDANATNTGEEVIFSWSGRWIVDDIPSDWIVMYTCNPEGWWSVTATC